MARVNGPLKWLFYRTETNDKCAWLQVGRMKMDANLKSFGRLIFFQAFVVGTQTKSEKLIFG